MLPWVIIFVLIPGLELYTLLEVGQLVGAPATIALIILTGVAGAYLTRLQGVALLRDIQNELSLGRLPADSLIDGLMVFAGGVLLLTPGLWTDLLGFSLVVPLSRAPLKNVVIRWIQKKIKDGTVTVRRID